MVAGVRHTPPCLNTHAARFGEYSRSVIESAAAPERDRAGCRGLPHLTLVWRPHSARPASRDWFFVIRLTNVSTLRGSRKNESRPCARSLGGPPASRAELLARAATAGIQRSGAAAHSPLRACGRPVTAPTVPLAPEPGHGGRRRSPAARGARMRRLFCVCPIARRRRVPAPPPADAAANDHVRRGRWSSCSRLSVLLAGSLPAWNPADQRQRRVLRTD